MSCPPVFRKLNACFFFYDGYSLAFYESQSLPSHIESLFSITIKYNKTTKKDAESLPRPQMHLHYTDTQADHSLFYDPIYNLLDRKFPSKITVCIAIFAANSTRKLYTPVDIEGNTIDLIRLVFSYTSSILNFSYHNSSLLLNLNFT